MPNILNIATTGLQASQRALANTGDNISNVNTEGYSRKTIDLASRDSTRYGNGFIGNGVDVTAITRNTDHFATKQIREAESIYQGINEFYINAQELDSLLSGDSSSLSVSLQSFFSAVNAVNSNPTDISSRQVLLSESTELIGRFHRLDQQLDEQVSQLNAQLTSMVANVNALGQALAAVNQQVVGGGAVAPELLDKRDSIVKEIAGYIDIQAVEETDGSISLSIGNGVSLVTGGSATALVTQPASSNPQLTGVAVLFNSQSFEVTNHLQGGTIGGLLSFRDGMLEDTRNSINRIALVISDEMNSQNQLGMDLKGNLGKSVFSDINTSTLVHSRSIFNTNNTGTMELSVNIADVTQLSTSDYRLDVTAGPVYQLVRLSDHNTATIAGFPATIDGFTLSIDSGTAKAGDSFLISPNKGASSLIDMNINSTNDFAIASPIRTLRDPNNTGTGVISSGVVTDTSNHSFTAAAKSLSPPIQVQFLSPTTYQLVNMNSSAVIEGPLTYDPNIENDLFPTPGAFDPGYGVTLSGTVNTADHFTIDYNTGGVADNRNGNLMAAIQTKKCIEGSTISLQVAYGSLVSSVGTQTHQAQISRDAGELLLQQAESRLDSVAGVNLDEEAANLLKFQQAYQASAQIISVVTRMFDTLMSAFR